MWYRHLASVAGSLLLTTASFALPQAGPGSNPLLKDSHCLIPEPGSQVFVLSLGDVDGDGDLDVFHGDAGLWPGGAWEGPNGLWINDGEGRFTETQLPFPNFEDVPTDALFVDVNGDGLPELFVAREYNDLGQFMNRGAMGFKQPLVPPPATGPCTVLATGDLDGDGDQDLLAGRDGQDLYLENDGAGQFTIRPWHLPVETTETYDLELVDIDGDLDLDLVVARDSDLRIFEYTAKDKFNASITTLPAGSYWVDSADVDADGDMDLLTSGSLLRQGPSGVFTTEPCTLGADFCDADGDGDLDILGPEVLGLNDGTGQFTDASHQFPVYPNYTFSAAVGDLDGDNDVDVLYEKIHVDGITNNVTRRSRLALNDGNAVFQGVTDRTIELPDRKANGVAMADMDGDGDLDIVTGGRIDGPGGTWEYKFFYFENDGNGWFTDRTEDLLPREETLVNSVALGDVDQDGDPDIVLGGHSNWDGGGGGVRLYLNEGPTGFTNATNLIAYQYIEVEDVVLGDVDGDNDLDILAVAEQWPPFGDILYLNDGTGNFSISTGFTAVAESTHEGALVDVDGDGDLDVITAGDEMRMFRNDGTGTFTEEPAGIPASNGSSLATGDVDGDGDLDLVVGRNGVDELFFNDGTGLFTPRPLPSTDLYTLDVDLFDLDDDGDLDLLATGHTDADDPYRCHLYLNDGTGQFTRDHHRLAGEVAGSNIAWGDTDQDGDLDVVLGGVWYDYGSYFSNLRRHLAWRWVPRVGKTLRLDVTGAPSGPWLLGGSMGTANIATTGGRLLLDPVTLWLADMGTLDSEGAAVVDIAVPNVPALIGTTVYWQALVDSPYRLTNLETTYLSGL